MARYESLGIDTSDSVPIYDRKETIMNERETIQAKIEQNQTDVERLLEESKKLISEGGELTQEGKKLRQELDGLNEVTYSIGDRFNLGESKYFLVQQDRRKVGMVSLRGGYMWHSGDGVEVGDIHKITQEEFDKRQLAGAGFIRYWDDRKQEDCDGREKDLRRFDRKDIGETYGKGMFSVYIDKSNLICIDSACVDTAPVCKVFTWIESEKLYNLLGRLNRTAKKQD